MATLGHGNRCRNVIGFFLMRNDVQCIAVCDARKDRLEFGKKTVDDHYGNKDCTAYFDFRELLARDDLDAVFIATGDRWHSLASIMAAKAGKDVYSEKPMSVTNIFFYSRESDVKG